MEDAAAREQQREARRQKVLARSQARQRTPIIEFASQPQSSDPMNLLVDADRPDDPMSVTDASAGQQEVKSGARLAAERRRQRILSRSNERMAKVQGDRTLSNKREEDNPEAGVAGDGALDKILDEAEREILEQGVEADANRSASPPAQSNTSSPKNEQPFEVSAGGSTPIPETSETADHGAEGADTKRVARKVAKVGFKPTPAQEIEGQSAGAKAASSGRRLAGNKALEKRSLDHSTMQHLTDDKSANRGKASSSRLRRIVCDLRFWVDLERFVKTILLLLVGAGVGGLILPQGRAAVEQSDFESTFRQGEARWRSNLESLLTRQGSLQGALGAERRGSLAFDVARDADGNVEIDEFGAAFPASANPTGQQGEFDSKEASMGGNGEETGFQGQCVEQRMAGEGVDVGANLEQIRGAGVGACAVKDNHILGGVIGGAIDSYLGGVHRLLKLTHAMTSRVWLPRFGVGASCVPAIFLVIIVRLLVVAVFFVLRLMLGLPAFPPAEVSGAPGMVMRLVRTYVPLVGNIVAMGSMMKSVLSDTSLVIAGTTLTLALCLGVETASTLNMFGMLGVTLDNEHGSKEEL